MKTRRVFGVTNAKVIIMLRPKTIRREGSAELQMVALESGIQRVVALSFLFAKIFSTNLR
ncbi:hypothetical protein [Leptospira noguchii]|nr:hypothetical protein [Leptospira noguchii]